MNKHKRSDLLEFPCAFPIKIIGRNSDAFHAAVKSILTKHLPGGEDLTLTSNLSSGNKYLSITVTINAESKEQLDRIYYDLNNHELVLITM